MNDMELLRELAQETPLPAPAELDAARARAGRRDRHRSGHYAKAAAEVTTGQPCPSSGQPAGPLRPPAPVLTAGKFMRGGAITSAAYLIAALPFTGGINGSALGHRLTATPLAITLVIVGGLAVIALWLHAKTRRWLAPIEAFIDRQAFENRGPYWI